MPTTFTGRPSTVTFLASPYLGTNYFGWPNLGLYAQDQIHLGPVTLFAGVRFDLQNVAAEDNATTLFL